MATKRLPTGEETQERMEALPPAVQEFVYSQAMAEVIEKIGEKNHLHFDQMGSLEIEAAHVILGFTEPQDFPETMADALSLSEEQAQAVSSDVDALLFQHVRELVRESMPGVTPVGVSVGSAPSLATPPSAAVSDKVSLADRALLEPTESTIQTIDITPESPIKRAVDPYREPIM